MANDIGLTVNGKKFSGWKSARVTRGIETVSGSFELEVSDRWSGQDERWLIEEEDECVITIGSETLLTGYVDRRSLSLSKQDRSLSVSGRDKTGMLVDCSAMLDQWEFNNIQLQALATRICEPYGITVKIQSRIGQAEIAPLTKVSADPGDSAFEVIERACRMAAVLPVSDGQGALLLTRAGTARATTALVEGENILEASADYDATSRHHDYLVLAQHRGSETSNGVQSAQVRAICTDANVKRVARTLVIRPEGNATTAYAKLRGQWEAKTRAVRGDHVTVTVHGWTQADGRVWPINALVKVKSPSIGVDGQMLISQVVYSIDSSGTLATLTLRRPDAFIPEPTVTKAKTTAWKQLRAGV